MQGQDHGIPPTPEGVGFLPSFPVRPLMQGVKKIFKLERISDYRLRDESEVASALGLRESRPLLN